MDDSLIPRRALATAVESLSGFRAVVIQGARQAGKSTLISRLAEDLGIDRATAEVYEPWMETTFLVHRLPAWSRKTSSRTVRRPKLHACDTGLASAIIGKGPEALGRLNDPSTGPLLESFVVAEIAKQLTWS